MFAAKPGTRRKVSALAKLARPRASVELISELPQKIYANSPKSFVYGYRDIMVPERGSERSGKPQRAVDQAARGTAF